MTRFFGFLRRAQYPLMLALGFLPVTVMITAGLFPAALGTHRLFPASYLLFAWLCLLIPGRFRAASGFVFAGLLLALGVYALPVGETPFILLVALFYAALLLFSLRIAVWPAGQEMPFNWYASGMIAHILLHIVLWFAHRIAAPCVYHPFEAELMLCFLAYLLLVLLCMNRTSVRSCAMGRQGVPRSMQRKNVGFTLALFAGVLLLAGIPALAKALTTGGAILWQLILSALALLARLLPEEASPLGTGGGGASDMMPGMESAAPSLLAVILERILFAVVWLGIAVFAFYVLRIALRQARRLIRLLLDRFSQYFAAVSEDYIDEITDTREEGGERIRAGFKGLRLAFVNEKRLSPSARIRHRYRILLHKHPDWPKSQTAREQIAHRAALYEQARYSDLPVTEEDAERFTDMTQHL